MGAMFADLKPVFELALVQVGLATVALDEDVLSLHHAFFGRNGFYALCFLTEPGHRNGGKRSIKELRIANCEFRIANFGNLTSAFKFAIRNSKFEILKLDTLLGPDSGSKWVFD